MGIGFGIGIAIAKRQNDDAQKMNSWPKARSIKSKKKRKKKLRDIRGTSTSNARFWLSRECLQAIFEVS